jgi:membrane protease YdiL (CAAX protease family)
VFGVTAALIYQYTGSTLVTFLMHAGQNTIAVAAAYYAIANGRV